MYVCICIVTIIADKKNLNPGVNTGFVCTFSGYWNVKVENVRILLESDILSLGHLRFMVFVDINATT